MTVLEIINEVQRKLRLPVSAALTTAHAALLLTFINEVQRNYMLVDTVWDELKVYPSVNTVAGTATYAVSAPSSGELDSIRSIQIGINDPLVMLDDGDFLAHKRANTTQAEPKKYRHRSRTAAGVITIEVSSTPDAAYQMDVEALIKPPRVTLSTDVPLLDAETIILGVTWLAKKDDGNDDREEFAAFQTMNALRAGDKSDSNLGDVEPI